MTERTHKRVRHKAGEPLPVDELTTAAQVDLEARIRDLASLTTDELRSQWQRCYQHRPPARLSRDLLRRGIAYAVQERVLGGLSAHAKRRLHSLIAAGGEGGGIGNPPPSALRPGTQLVREWHQRVHTVNVLDDGFEYDGERYASLSRIARRITGTAWSGPRFFGIAKPGRQARGGAHG